MRNKLKNMRETSNTGESEVCTKRKRRVIMKIFVYLLIIVSVWMYVIMYPVIYVSLFSGYIFNRK